MKLENIKGNYDAIYSLGDLCLVALQLRKNNLRPHAGPLDWMATPFIPNLIQLLENRFEDYMKRENLLSSGYSTGVDQTTQYLCLTDMTYLIVSSHDFKASENTFSNLETYPFVKAKFDRRINRFLDSIENGKRTLFIRTEGSFNEIFKLNSALSKLVKNEYTLLVINHAPTNTLIEKNWPMSNVCSIDLPNKEKWHENDHYWKEIFNGISIQ